jgi:ribosomal protein S18 acetylase RimI-like enzyme
VIPDPAGSTIELERASDSDLPALADLMNAAYGGTGEIASWTHVKEFIVGDRTSPAALRAEMAGSPRAALLVVRRRETGALRASVWLEPRSASVWYLGSLTVDPREQNSGLGRRIMEAAERRIAALGGTRVVIDVLNVRESLIAWYERRGYRLTGETHPFPYEDQRYGVPQRPDLRFLVLEKGLAAG